MATPEVLLAYGSWIAAPFVAWQSLAAGVEGRGRALVGVLVVYALAVLLIWTELRGGWTGTGPVAPAAVLVPGLGTLALSAALYVFGRWTRGRR